MAIIRERANSSRKEAIINKKNASIIDDGCMKL